MVSAFKDCADSQLMWDTALMFCKKLELVDLSAQIISLSSLCQNPRELPASPGRNSVRDKLLGFERGQ
jgi:hypothetical protein